MVLSNTASLHGKESWDDIHTLEDKKDQYICSMCKETFDLLAKLLAQTQVHEEIRYKCDECDWRFYLIPGLTLHGRDCHDNIYHACVWCVEYFDSGRWATHTHIRSKHHFECSICHDISPTAEELEEHGKQKHGGLQPDKQELEMQRHREEKLEQSE